MASLKQKINANHNMLVHARINGFTKQDWLKNIPYPGIGKLGIESGFDTEWKDSTFAVYKRDYLASLARKKGPKGKGKGRDESASSGVDPSTVPTWGGKSPRKTPSKTPRKSILKSKSPMKSTTPRSPKRPKAEPKGIFDDIAGFLAPETPVSKTPKKTPKKARKPSSPKAPKPSEDVRSKTPKKAPRDVVKRKAKIPDPVIDEDGDEFVSVSGTYPQKMLKSILYQRLNGEVEFFSYTPAGIRQFAKVWYGDDDFPRGVAKKISKKTIDELMSQKNSRGNPAIVEMTFDLADRVGKRTITEDHAMAAYRAFMYIRDYSSIGSRFN